MNQFNQYWRFLLAALTLAAVLSGCSTFPWQYDFKQVEFTAEPETLIGDLYLPKSAQEPTPAVVVVHGGSWVRRTGDMSSISSKLAARGIAAFNITYRFAMDHPYPAAVDDVTRAIKWLQDNSERFNIDPERIAGWGYSAGGQLILRAGLDPNVGLRAIVSGGTPARFAEWPQSPIITQFIGKPYPEASDVWEDASPVNHVQAGSPPVFLYHGERDTLVEPLQMELMADALDRKRIPHRVHLVEGKGHFATYLFGGQPETLAIEFLQQQFRL